MTNKKVLIAMSGGVDSSVAAYLMTKQGYSCIGATMKLLDGTDDAINDAKKVADSLSIPFYTFDMRDEFKAKIIDSFISSYENGDTPNPCVLCNKEMKFGLLLKKAEELGCDILVTGHYARVIQQDGKYLLKKAVDTQKDQSYFLYSLTPEVLSKVMFPLGEYTKEQIREIASELSLPTAEKRDSQDICFVPDGDYSRFIRSVTDKAYPIGDFVDINGTVLGKHSGIINYTTGQRKGLGIALGKPAYVIGKDISQNHVILGDDQDLFCTTLKAKHFNSTTVANLNDPLYCKAKIRYRHQEQDAKVTFDGSSFSVEFDKPQRAATPGQSVVLYDQDTVLGGGIIE